MGEMCTHQVVLPSPLVISVANPRFGQGEPQNFFLRFCQHSEVKLGERTFIILAGVQGPT